MVVPVSIAKAFVPDEEKDDLFRNLGRSFDAFEADWGGGVVAVPPDL